MKCLFVEKERKNILTYWFRKAVKTEEQFRNYKRKLRCVILTSIFEFLVVDYLSEIEIMN